MHLSAICELRRMRGRTSPGLVLCSDNLVYVVKYGRADEEELAKASEYLATAIGLAVGLPIPPYAVVKVPPNLDHVSPQCRTQGRLFDPPKSGLYFASRHVAGNYSTSVLDLLPELNLKQISNLDSFAGALAFDQFCHNMAPRQAVFSRCPGARCYQAHFVGQGGCLRKPADESGSRRAYGMYLQPSVYESVAGFESFEPYLSRLTQISLDTVRSLTKEIPSEWYQNDRSVLDQMIKMVLLRRSTLREMLLAVRSERAAQFPEWKLSRTAAQPRTGTYQGRWLNATSTT